MKVLQFVCIFISVIVSNGEEICGCYMLGTIGNIEGESLCDSKTAECKCYPNIIGKNCDKCKEGYYNIISGRGCLNCNCDLTGSVNKTCNEHTGRCFCKTGYAGFRCDKCESYSFSSSEDKCTSCNCNKYGSKDLQCNPDGHCTCIDNVEGIQCNKCKNNMYDIQKRCIDCPQCYTLVEKAVNAYSTAFNDFKKLIDSAENQFPLNKKDNESFILQFNLLAENITHLKLLCEKNLGDKITVDNLNFLFNEMQAIEVALSNLTQKASSIDFKDINGALYNIRQNLKNSKEFINECEYALKNATTISKTLGRHSKAMIHLTETSNTKYKDIQSKAQEFSDLATNITITCNETCNLAEKFLNTQTELDTNLKNIQQEIANKTLATEIILNYLTEFLDKTNATKIKAYDLLTQSKDLTIPEFMDADIDIDNDEINKTINDFKKIAVEIQNNENKASNVLDSILNKQHAFNETLLFTNEAELQADNSVQTINNILKLAMENLDNMKDGYKNVSKDVSFSLQEIPKIQAKIDAVFEHADDINSIFEEVHNIVDDMDEIHKNVSRILISVDRNENEVDLVIKEVEEHEKTLLKLKEDLATLEQNLRKVKKALKSYSKFNNEIEADINQIEDLIRYLSVFPTTNEELNNIDAEITLLEDMFITIDNYKDQKLKLEEDVEHVKRILESLPFDDLCESAKNEPKTIP